MGFLAINLIAPWHGEVQNNGGNYASVQPKNRMSVPLKPAIQQQATSVQQQPTAAQSVQPPHGPPELRSIIWIPTKPSAQLDKSFAFEGDTLRGYKVTKIRKDSVDLITPEGADLKLVLPTQVAGK